MTYALLFFGLGANYIFNIVAARFLGPTNFGDFSYALYLFNIFSLVAVFSLDQAAIKFIPQTTHKSEILPAIQLFSVISGVVFSIVFLITIYLFLQGERAKLAYLFVPSLIPFVLLTVNVAILQAEHIVVPRMAFRYVIEPTTKFIIFLLLFFYLKSSSAPVIALLFALIVTNVAALVTYKKRLLNYAVSFSKVTFNALIRFSVPMSASNAVNILSGRLDVIILGLLVSASDMGHYSAAFQTSAIIAIVLQGIETIYAPIFSGHIGLKNFDALKSDYQRAMRWAIMLSSPIIIIFIIYPEIVMFPFGAQYQQASLILSILCIGQFFVLAMASANIILILLGKTKIVFWNSILYVVMMAMLVGVGANYFGVIGAAIGVVFSLAVPNMLRVFLVYKLTGSHPFSAHYLKILLSLAFSIVVGFICKSYVLNVGIFIFPILFFILLVLLGMHDEDKNIAISFLRKLRNISLKA